MAKKKTGLSQTLFRDIDPYAHSATTVEGVTAVALTAVLPDPGQPRQLLPPDLSGAVMDGRLTPAEAMRQWLNRDSANSDQRLADVRKLANSIAKHGLINPITIRPPQANETTPPGITYRIVTGERRFWAHVLLNLEGQEIHAGSEIGSADTIRATLVADGISIRAHQLIENIIREDINAVEKARGLWALRYELSGITDSQVNDSSPQMDESQNSADSSPHLVPWLDVCAMLDISPRYRIFLTSVLNLSPPAQELVMTHHLAEMTIRPIVQKLKHQPELQLVALRQLVAWQTAVDPDDGPRAITKAVQELVERLLKQEANTERAAQTTTIQQTPETERLSRKVRDTLRFLNRLPEGQRATVAQALAAEPTTIQELHALRTQIDNLLALITPYRTKP